MGKIKCIAFLLVAFFTFSSNTIYSQTISGTITDAESNEPLIGAAVIIKGTTTGAQTDFDGKFSFDANQKPPFTLFISYLGYDNLEYSVAADANLKNIKIKLKPSSVKIEGVEVVDSRISEKQKESALTVETMGIIAIKETPAANFYEGLGNLKGVDVTASSLSFKVINTRGFNSTAPVRSLQTIDGVDNQSPGLNFSLGNFLGASELDVQKVDLIVGASSAYYGPNAFNGVIAMQTKDPFIHNGLSVMVKGGERAMFESAIRFAQPIKNKKGEERFAYKLNMYYLRANDWEAENYDPATDSERGKDNPGGYDAVNIYGDEDLAGGNNFSGISNEINNPGLGIFYRTGYREIDLVDYNTRNYKASASLHYKIKEDVEFIAASSFGAGTTVFQGENRYNLKGILFFQNRLEVKKENKFFVRAYATNENAGNSFDAVVTAFRMNEASKQNADWNRNYSTYWNTQVRPRVRALGDENGTLQDMFLATGFPTFTPYDTARANAILSFYNDSIVRWHQETRNNADNAVAFGQVPWFAPGTERFDSMQAVVKSRLFNEGGSRFYDRSALYHLHGEYKLTPKDWAEVTVGANGRLYAPNSRGTIFSDSLLNPIDTLEDGRKNPDGEYRRITNWEFGIYTGIDKKFFDNKFKANFAIRLDKNQNFNFLVSPALSLVYNANINNTFRLSFSSAIRNPTLADQYLYYDVGRAILLGNLQGYDSLVTISSFVDFLNSQRYDTLNFFSVDPIRPEVCRSVEVGYRGTLFKHLYVDASYYYSFYQYFIGYKLGIDLTTDSSRTRPLEGTQAYRIATNSPDLVTTQGFSVALSYFFKKYYTLSGNYSWNVIDLRNADEEIIPAFNTPPNKFNVGISGRTLPIKIRNFRSNNWGFSVNYKWVQGFTFTGSPQFTGDIPSYGMLDAQINKAIPKAYCTIKVGASNLLNNKVFLVYGGPRVGRLTYVSLLFEFDKMFKEK